MVDGPLVHLFQEAGVLGPVVLLANKGEVAFPKNRFPFRVGREGDHGLGEAFAVMDAAELTTQQLKEGYRI